jgi:hypothetical protein
MSTEHALEFPVACLYLLTDDDDGGDNGRSQSPIEVLRL